MAEQQWQFPMPFASGAAVDATGSYCNDVLVNTSVWDFMFDFRQMYVMGQAQPGEAPPIGLRVAARIIMTPQHAKAFASILAQTISSYEEAFGEIPDLRPFVAPGLPHQEGTE